MLIDPRGDLSVMAFCANRQTTELTDASYNLPASEVHKQFARMHAQRGRQLEDIQ